MDAIKSLDRVSPDATDTLVSLADASWAEHQARPAFEAFFSR